MCITFVRYTRSVKLVSTRLLHYPICIDRVEQWAYGTGRWMHWDERCPLTRQHFQLDASQSLFTVASISTREWQWTVTTLLDGCHVSRLHKLREEHVGASSNICRRVFGRTFDTPPIGIPQLEKEASVILFWLL